MARIDPILATRKVGVCPVCGSDLMASVTVEVLVHGPSCEDIDVGYSMTMHLETRPIGFRVNHECQELAEWERELLASHPAPAEASEVEGSDG